MEKVFLSSEETSTTTIVKFGILTQAIATFFQPNNMM